VSGSAAGMLARPPYAGLTCLGETPGPVPLGETPALAEQLIVPARDGVRLATDVYLPRRPGRGPAILVRLPYDKSGDHAWIPHLATRLIEDGYAVVAQDVRGKGRSEGRTLAFEHEAADGAATLDWIERQRRTIPCRASTRTRGRSWSISRIAPCSTTARTCCGSRPSPSPSPSSSPVRPS